MNCKLYFVKKIFSLVFTIDYVFKCLFMLLIYKEYYLKQRKIGLPKIK